MHVRGIHRPRDRSHRASVWRCSRIADLHWLGNHSLLFSPHAPLTYTFQVFVWFCYREVLLKRDMRRAWTVFVWTFMMWWLCWLNVARIDNWTTPTWTLNISGCVMLMVIKYTSLGKLGISEGNDVTLTEWLGWTYFLPSLFAGPTIELTEYLRYASFRYLSPSTASKGQRSVSVFIESIWYLPFVIIGQQLFPIAAVATFEAHHGMLYRILFLWVAMWCIRCRYYFSWKISEASYVACGASTFHSTGGCNVNVWQVEQSDNVRDVLNNWNLCAAYWLKRHVYEPCLRYLRNEKAAILVTNVVSAVWHGIYPGYFVTFILAGLATSVGRLTHTNVVPRVAKLPEALQALYKLFMTVAMAVLVCTIGLPFQVFTLEMIWESWKGVYFMGHVWLSGLAIIALASRP